MKYIFVVICCCLFGCNGPEAAAKLATQQELRHQYFVECLEKVPKGPITVKYNDWSEVVNECGSQAYYQSLR